MLSRKIQVDQLTNDERELTPTYALGAVTAPIPRYELPKEPTDRGATAIGHASRARRAGEVQSKARGER